MKREILKVKTADGDTWEFSANIVENFDEANELYSQKGAFEIFMAGLLVKIMNVAREGFRKGKNREEVEKDVANYKPLKMRISTKAYATELLLEHSDLIKKNSSLQKSVMKAFMANDFKNVIMLLDN